MAAPCSAADIDLNATEGLSQVSHSYQAYTAIAEGADLPLKQMAVALGNLKPERRVRGAREVKIYKELSGSVVLILTKDNLGSGTLIDSRGTILTNYHVVEGQRDVSVIFKPTSVDQTSNADVIYREGRFGKVIKVDQVADLALIRVDAFPTDRTPIPLGERGEVTIGDDVHAIGHPLNYAWTYTKGLVSQIRDDYSWTNPKDPKTPKSSANVLQTQTPISPGNSGGPLLSDNGRLVGVNTLTYSESTAQNLNFAVAVDEVRRFLSMKGDRINRPALETTKTVETEKNNCSPKTTFKGQSKDGKDEIISFDTNCDGKNDAMIISPLDRKKAARYLFDKNFDGKVDQIAHDIERNGKWQVMDIDVDFDGAYDLRCDLREGTLIPKRCEKYSS